MLFTDDTVEALRAAVHLVNTAEEPETLATPEDFEGFLEAFPYTGRIDRDSDELSTLRALRPRLRGMLLAPRADMVAGINDALRDVTFDAHVVRHDEADWHLHAVADDRPLAERILAETAMALLDVVRADEGSRLAVCADEDCEGIVLDLSRNRSRRYCSTACTNRNAVAAYRARQR
ncbi:CGNR zinc finger domain-containing protein [Microbacterium murale]|uniref:RNA-binding Zn ribbon-like protein n=1 Tax=Microbacterium murale TaxID=1081040 RepID=A0ABU0P6F7_9MICO|nr:CGNR zinc finger domain-containing protein [Microbacterium murale]MDQ0642919.1 putative RNA-binding Zn ribbon-like protein [Microbacterium murale]